MSRPDVELRIEELVLHGFAPDDQRRLAEAIELELVHLFDRLGVPAALRQGGDWPQLADASFEVGSDAGAEVVGAEVARALYGGLRR